jgi:hypothetical protein
MPNIKVTLMMRVKTDAGWRYYPAAYAANNRVKAGVRSVPGPILSASHLKEWAQPTSSGA